jgi:hypothetical protein
MFAQQKMMAASFVASASSTINNIPPEFRKYVTAKNYAAFGNFTVKAFETIDQFNSYIGSDDYGTDGRPGVCFGFKIT